MLKKAIYNKIGKTYDATRRADPGITKKLIELLCPMVNGCYLDIGCGSGNYTGALSDKGLNIEGIDISEEMLRKARQKYPHIVFHQGDARRLPFNDRKYHGVISTFATHHIGDYVKTFQEAHRVIKQGKIVIFTTTPEQMQYCWLWHYFPKMMKGSANMMISFINLHNALNLAGFSDIQQVPYFVSNAVEDWFLQAGKYRPEIYLQAEVRAGISSFQLFSDPKELEEGLHQLEIDVQSGEIKKIIEQFENSCGDCMYVTGDKL